VLAVGTVEPRKGLVDLVRAFDELAAADDADRPEPERIRLVVAGPDGWGTAAFEAAVAAARYRSRIVRLGWVDDTARADLLAGAAVLAYPSLYEGFGLPPLEAMTVGVPVVCSDAGPLPEIVGDAARLVPAADPAALAAGLAEVLADDAVRRRLAEAGPAHAARYGWDRCVRSMGELYRRILAVG
jgi:alpha-1,3-rhamnosyl/mannosyltransferase